MSATQNLSLSLVIDSQGAVICNLSLNLVSFFTIVPTFKTSSKPLLGVAMMVGYHLEIDFADNGFAGKNYRLGIM
jgi:hypothetical protein